MYLHCRPDASQSNFYQSNFWFCLLSKQFLIFSWLPDRLKMNSKLDSKFDIIDNLQWYKDNIRSVDRIWVHLLILQRSQIFTSIIWSSKFWFWSEILKSTLLITCCDIRTSIWSVGQIRVHLFISKQSLIFVSIIWYKICILK